MLDLLLTNIGQLATPIGSAAHKGRAQGQIHVLNHTCIGIHDGKITYIGTQDDALDTITKIDCKGSLVTPGLIDAHTHLVFGGYRQHELNLKLAGASYLDILKSGGGILSTVTSTRGATYNELYDKAKHYLNEMLVHGTTTAEIKSGYGLDMDTEIKQLKVIKALSASYNIAATFMGAHAIPDEYKNDPDAYVSFIIQTMLPQIKADALAEFCDVFTENSVFTIQQSDQILSAASKLGFNVKIHADEIVPMGGAALAAKHHAISAEHLLESSDEDLQQMAQSGTIAVLLPATSFYLNKKYARARDMINMNIPVAIATDFNPGSSPNFNMQLVLNLAYLKLKMTPAEALTAATLNAAAAIGFEQTKGSIEVGKDADLIIWACPDLDYLFYRYGNNQVSSVIKNGVLIHS